jgi:hypothetical protein
MAMDERLKKRIYAFYLAGALNLILGCWVLIHGGDLKQSTRSIMMLFFFGFAALDFWFPSQLKKKYNEEKAQFERMQRERAEKAEQANGQQQG